MRYFGDGPISRESESQKGTYHLDRLPSYEMARQCVPLRPCLSPHHQKRHPDSKSVLDLEP